MDIKTVLKAEAKSLGFADCRIAKADPAPHFDSYLQWIKQGCHAGMAYMGRPDAILARKTPQNLLSGCQTVICLGLAYRPNPPKYSEYENPVGRIAAYATYPDYHELIRTKLEQLASFLKLLAPNSQVLVCVDTSPLLEKTYAQAAGLGWIGRNSLLSHPYYGSWMLIGELLTDLELEPDAPLGENICKDCQRCQMACPTKALLPNKGVNAQRCLSYLSIEHRGPIPMEFREKLGTRLFGCDTCQIVCPLNSKDIEPNPVFKPVLDADQDLISILKMDAQAFKAAFKGTPVLRAKLEGLKRNAALCLGNSGEAKVLPILKRLQREESNPVVSEALQWAIHHLEQQNSEREHP